MQRVMSAEVQNLAESPPKDESFNALHGPQGQDVHEENEVSGRGGAPGSGGGAADRRSKFDPNAKLGFFKVGRDDKCSFDLTIPLALSLPSHAGA